MKRTAVHKKVVSKRSEGELVDSLKASVVNSGGLLSARGGVLASAT
jgi:adhesin HecA-like repeat protein